MQLTRASVLFLLAIVAGCGIVGNFNEAYGKQTKGNLGSIRSALAIYYGDMEGLYPDDLAAIENRRWLEKLPMAQTMSLTAKANVGE